MDVRVDDAGQRDEPARVELLAAAGQVRPDRRDPPVGDRDVARRAAAEDEVRAHASPRTKPSRTSSATATSAASTASSG